VAECTAELEGGSVEFVYTKVTSNRDPQSSLVDMAVMVGSTKPLDADFHDAIWVGDIVHVTHDTYEVTAKILVGPGTTVGVLAPGRYTVWVRIHAAPELPRKIAGPLKIF
jgi:hypothetical protein